VDVPDQGGRTAVVTGASSGIGKGYPHRVSSSARSHDEQAQRRLWQESERLTGVRYPDI
jgi:NAD(P)-dependent dehydrogenase (short-subunit alcohol dehydrogenase family)